MFFFFWETERDRELQFKDKIETKRRGFKIIVIKYNKCWMTIFNITSNLYVI